MNPNLLTMPTRAEARTLSDEELGEIAVDAYVYAFPLVLMELTRRAATNIAAPGFGKAPVNRFGHMVHFPDAAFNDVVSPSPDTLSSILWFDVSSEPLVIHKPDSGGRYHLLPMLDMWTDVFASPGSRTTGNGDETFAIVGPRWRGVLPNDIPSLVSPTEQGCAIGRIQTNGAADYPAVHAFQNALTACPLSLYGGTCNLPPHHVDTTLSATPPLDQVLAMDVALFFQLFSQLARRNPPHPHDQPILARMARLGLEPGKVFGLTELSEPARDALVAAPGRALQQLQIEAVRTARVVNGWRFIAQPIGAYGADYLHRASVAYSSLGANVAEDACYAVLTTDDRGRPLSSETAFVLHFERSSLPPVRGFWSVTVYNERRFFADNSLGRFALGDRDALRINADGSLDLWIQRDDPGEAKRANWLPTPKSGSFSLTLRLYWPKPEALLADWRPPPLTIVA